MSRRPSFNRLARQELLEAMAYYEAEASGLGDRFLSAVEKVVAELVEFPESAPIVRRDIRRKLVPRFPYSLLYKRRGEEIRILAVAHQKRRPFYWVGRS